MDKKDKGKQKVVVIAGGGLGGLTCAMELAERGYKVRIYEASSVVGGKAACEEYNENLIRDHSIKNFPAYYYCLFETLKRIPFDEDDKSPVVYNTEGRDLNADVGKKPDKTKKVTKTVFDNLRPVKNLKCVLPDKTIFEINTRLDTSLRTKYREFIQFRTVLRKQGLSEKKVDRYVKKHARMMWICKQRKLDTMAQISYEDYLGFDPKKHHETALLLSLVEIISASKIDGSAYACTDQCLKIFGRFFNPHNLTNTGNVLNGTIQHKFLEPWVKYLQSLGVEIYVNKQVKQVVPDESDKDKIKGFELEDGTFIDDADHYVLNLPYSRLKLIINESNLVPRFKQIPCLDSALGEKWGHTIHFALKQLPEGAVHTQVYAVLGSPWSLIYYYITTDLWQGEKYPSKEAPVMLWVTASDCLTPGTKIQKPYNKCTMEEFREEILHQIHFKEEDKNLIVDWIPGRGLGWWNKKEQKMYPQAGPLSNPSVPNYFDQGPPKHGERISEIDDEWDMVCEAPLYAREIDMPEFNTSTNFKNLFLAGELVKTTQMVSTMEKANEGGKRCAHVICEKDKISYPVSKFEYDPLPFKFLRGFDAMFYCCCPCC